MKTISSLKPSLIVLALMLSGCATLAPDYERPALPVADHWRIDGAGAIPATADISGQTARISDLAWEQFVADEYLRQLIQTAIDNNRDLRIAALNIEKARAQYRIQRSELFPSIGISASETAQRTPGVLTQTGTHITSHSYSVGIGVTSFELDLFGKIRSLKENALQEYLSSEEARRSAELSLIGEVIANYMNLTSDYQQLKLANDTLKSREDAYQLQLQLKRLGQGSELTVRQAESEMEGARAQTQVFRAAVGLDKNALEVLIGQPLATDIMPDKPLESLLALKQVPAGLPSDLLQDRPDILAAEHHLIAVNANIGAARAAFFPSISLTASTGTASNSLSDLFSSGTRAWSFMPQINLPIFTWGRLTATLDAANAEQKVAVAQYEKAIQAAFREVADGLIQQDTVASQLNAVQKQTNAAQISYDLVQQRYKAGISSYLEVLDAQRTLFAAQQNLLNVRLAYQVNLVNLYKALGGGSSGILYTIDNRTSKEQTSNS